MQRPPNLISDSPLVQETFDLLSESGGRATFTQIADSIFHLTNATEELTAALIADLIQNDPRFSIEGNHLAIKPDGRYLDCTAGLGGHTVAIAALLLTACRLPGSAQDCSTVQIEWVDFIQIGSTQYVAGPGAPTTLQESDLGPVVGHVKFKVAGNVCDPNYRPKDGERAAIKFS